MHPYLSYLAAAAKHQDDLRRASQRRLARPGTPREGRRWLWLLGRGPRRQPVPVIIDLTTIDPVVEAPARTSR